MSDAGRDLHFNFVGLLFALAAAQIGVEAADFVDAKATADISWPVMAAVMMHLLLAGIAIATS